MSVTREFIAEAYLRMIDPADPRAGYYVRSAARHGVTPVRIAEITRIPLNRVDILLHEAA